MSDSLDIDLYQASMLRAYFYNNLHEKQGAMEAFARKLPNKRSFFVVAGIDRIVEYLASLQFSEEDIEVLKSIESLKVDDYFCNYLRSIDFSQDLKLISMKEGEIAFPNEPILRIEGPVGLCQYVEKKILSILNHDIRVASKAARVVMAAKGRPVFEFGGRRAHDASSADAARAAYIAGCDGTSSVSAYQKYNIPAIGTMGHVWVMSHETEIEAFENWNNVFPESVYLVDTYNSRSGTEHAIDVCDKVNGIRLDSGDLASQSNEFKRLLIDNDNFACKIIASDDLNEYKISDLLQKDAKIDAFGVGTEIVATPDAPTCGFIYKLVSVEHDGVENNICKIADGGKATWPARKQVWRHFVVEDYKTQAGLYTHDLIDVYDSDRPEVFSFALLHDVEIKKYNRKERFERILTARNHFKECISEMPAYIKLILEHDIENFPTFPVQFSESLMSERSKIIK